MPCSRERVRNAVEQSGISAGSVLRSGVCGDYLPHRPDVLRAVVPEPPEVVGDTVHYEFIRIPDSTGFGEYTADGGRRYFRELTDEILASRSPGRNRYRRHCHSRSVLCLLGPNGFARVDGEKLGALLVGSRWDP